MQRSWLTNSRGEPFALYEWGPVGAPALLFHHATGFCATTWAPIVEPLARSHRIFAFDARGHGDSTKDVGELSWELFGADLAEVGASILQRFDIRAFHGGVGHSLGGTAMLWASVLNPHLFERLCVIEPVLLDEGAGGRSALSVATRLRQSEFPSRPAARESLSRGLLARFDARTLDAYVDDALDATGPLARLKCAPLLEARIYELGRTRAWEALEDIRCSVRIIAALRGRFGPIYQQVMQRCPDWELFQVDAGHLVVMEDPTKTGVLLADWLRAR